MATDAPAGPGDVRLAYFCFDVLARHLGVVKTVRPLVLEDGS